MPKPARGKKLPAKSAKPNRKSPILMRCFLACDSASRISTPDGHGEKTLLHGLFDTVWVGAFPAVHPTFCLFVQLLSAVKKKSPLKIIGENSDGDPILETQEVSVQFNPNRISEIIAKIPFMPVGKLKDIRFVVKIDGQRIGWNFDLKVRKVGTP